jgi:hypothetical protein
MGKKGILGEAEYDIRRPMPSITAGDRPTPRHGGWWRPMGAASHRPHARSLRPNATQPSGQIPCQQDQGLVIEPYPADRTHKEFNVNFQPYMPDPQRFEIQGEPRVSRKTCANVIGDLNIKSPGIIILPGQQVALKAHRYVFRNPEEALWMAYFISSDELHWLDIECAYRRRYETGGISPFFLFNHTVFTLLRVCQSLNPLRLRAGRLDGGAPLLLPVVPF